MVYDSIQASISAEPKLPGIQSLLSLDPKQLGQGFTEADIEILAGALYLEAKRKVEDITKRRRPIAEGDVNAVLAKPIDLANFGRDYFVKVLSDAKTRREVDADFRAKLENAQAAASRKTCLGGTPRWICVGMAVVVVVAIVLVILI